MKCPLCEALIDPWTKTVKDREGDTFPVCSPCWDSDRSGLVLVPGEIAVWARCVRHHGFVNPRDIVPETLRPAVWKEAAGGTCKDCYESKPDNPDMPDRVIAM